MKYIVFTLLICSIIACNSSKKRVENQAIQKEGTKVLVDFNRVTDGILYGAGEEGITAGYKVVKSEEELNNLIQKMQLNNPLDINPHKGFYDEYVYIFLFDEVRGTGGYTFRVRELYQRENKIYINTQSIAPKENAQTVLTQPFTVISTTKFDMPITYLSTER